MVAAVPPTIAVLKGGNLHRNRNSHNMKIRNDNMLYRLHLVG